LAIWDTPSFPACGPDVPGQDRADPALIGLENADIAAPRQEKMLHCTNVGCHAKNSEFLDSQIIRNLLRWLLNMGLGQAAATGCGPGNEVGSGT
jgi:hypothetical protein